MERTADLAAAIDDDKPFAVSAERNRQLEDVGADAFDIGLLAGQEEPLIRLGAEPLNLFGSGGWACR